MQQPLEAPTTEIPKSVKDDILYWAPLGLIRASTFEWCVPGLTREYIMGLCMAQGVECNFRPEESYAD